ncbi:MAG: hypothetical protein ACE5OZ_23280 [Candidatus Heimdallarchaeota archaeon]
MASWDPERIILPILILGGLLAALIIFLVFELRELAFIIFAISAFIGVFYSGKITKDS